MPSPKTPPKAPAIAALIALVGLPLASHLMADTKADEGEKRVAYRDLGGVWTICRGTTKGVHQGQVATEEECDADTAADLATAVKGIERCAPVLKSPTRENQLRAAVRLSNNIGVGGFCKGWWKHRPSIAALMNAGQWRAACIEFLRYDLVNGKPVQGLLNRRKRESAMCLEGLA